MNPITCTTCGNDVHHLEIFPGNVCLKCWADSPAGRYIPTARELSRMWGSK